MGCTVVYIGGPNHGEVEDIDCDVLNAPRELSFPTFDWKTWERGEVVYERREQADTPGRIAYLIRDESKKEAND